MSAPSADDRAREALAEQFNRKEPTAAKLEYTEQEWAETFERPWIIPNERYLSTSTEIVGSGGHAYCRRCAVQKKHGKLAAFRLHVAYEDDVMKVAKHGLIHVTCHGCEFDMYVPRSPRKRKRDEWGDDPSKMQDMINRQMAQQARQQQTAREIELRYGAAMQQIKSVNLGQAHEQELLDRLREQILRNAEMTVNPPIYAALPKLKP